MSEAVSDMSSDMLRIYVSEIFRHVTEVHIQGVSCEKHISMFMKYVFRRNFQSNVYEKNAVKIILFFIFVFYAINIKVSSSLLTREK